MFNTCILYGFGMSFYLRCHYHNRIVFSNEQKSIGSSVTRFLIKLWVTGTFVVLAIRAGFPGPGYTQWWENYSVDHSMILWFLTTIPLTIILWAVKQITFHVMKNPYGHQWYGEDNLPEIHSINMCPTTFWNVIFYLWLLLTPTLPFYSCFIRFFCLGSSTPAMS